MVPGPFGLLFNIPLPPAKFLHLKVHVQAVHIIDNTRTLYFMEFLLTTRFQNRYPVNAGIQDWQVHV